MGLLNKAKPREKLDLWAEDSLSSQDPQRQERYYEHSIGNSFQGFL